MDAPREMTLPPDLAQAVRDRAMEGGYVDELDVIRDALGALSDDRLSRDADFEATVRARYAAWKAGTRPTISMEDIRAEFIAEHASTRE